MPSFKGKTRRTFDAARKRGPVAVPKTGRTTVKGDRTGLKVARPTVEFAKRDGSANTVIPPHTRKRDDDGVVRVHGMKHGVCRACGHRRLISTGTLLCGTKSCRDRRVRLHAKRRAQRLAS